MGHHRYGGLVATASVKGVKGGSESIVIRASDGRYYVAKAPQNPQHRRTVVNDFLASGLAHLIGLPTPAPTTVYIPTDLSVTRSISGTEWPVDCGRRSSGGTCFASLMPVDPTGKAIYDYIPTAMWSEVANRDVALGCWLFDAWTSNADHVQVVFHRVRKRRGLPGRYWLTKIDHGYCFNAQDWTLTNGVRRMAYWQTRPAAGLSALSDFEPYYTSIRSVTVDAIRDILQRIPPEWLVPGEAGMLERLANQLVQRARQIPSLWNVWWPAGQIEKVAGPKT